MITPEEEERRRQKYGYTPEQWGVLKAQYLQTKDDEKSTALERIGDVFDRLVSSAVQPIKSAWNTYGEEREAGLEMMKGSIKDIGWSSPLKAAMGAVQYIGSPVTAIGKEIVGKPIEQGLEGVGVPKGVAEFAGKIGEEAIWFVPVGGTVRQMMVAGKAGVKAAENLGKVERALGKSVKEAIPKAEPTKLDAIRKAIDEAPLKEFKAEGKAAEFTTPLLKKGIVDDITKGAEEAIAGNLDKSKRIFKQIGERLALGEISGHDIPEILRKYEMSSVEFAKFYEDTVSTAGHLLGRHGFVKRQLTKAFADHPEAMDILGRLPEPSTMDKVFDVYGRVDNFRRAMLVGQVATSMRNAISQVGRLSVGMMDEALQGAIKGTVGYQGETFKQVREGLSGVTAAIGKLDPARRKAVLNILDSEAAAMSKARLFSQPVHEAQLGGKIANAVNALNRGQEFFFRRLAFEAKLNQLLAREGKAIKTVDPKQIPAGMLEEATNYALEMTFAASPKSKAAQKFVRAWTDIPGATLINPFPRFNFANAVPFILEHSPLGYIKALKPETIKALASGNPEVFAKAASRATIGSMMLDSAMRIRQSEYAGEKWYEVKIGENDDGSAKYVDTRAFAPFSTYLFLAEAIVNPDNVSAIDYAQAAVGLNRIAGTGLVVIDMLRAKSGETFKKIANSFLGQYLSGYTVPLRTAKDLYSVVDKKEDLYRDYKESPRLAPTLMNIPKVSQMVPTKPSPIRSDAETAPKTVEVGGKEVPSGLLRQLTGLTIKTKTAIEREIDEIQMPWESIAPRTGVPRADRALYRYMSPIVEKRVGEILKQKKYNSLPPLRRRILLSEIFREIKADARTIFEAKHPDLALQVQVKNLNMDMKQFLKEEIKKRTHAE